MVDSKVVVLMCLSMVKLHLVSKVFFLSVDVIRGNGCRIYTKLSFIASGIGLYC